MAVKLMFVPAGTAVKLPVNMAELVVHERAKSCTISKSLSIVFLSGISFFRVTCFDSFCFHTIISPFHILCFVRHGSLPACTGHIGGRYPIRGSQRVNVLDKIVVIGLGYERKAEGAAHVNRLDDVNR